MIALTRRYQFPAAHVLANPSFTEERNRDVFGKCANPNGHGHNYGVEVTVTGPVDAATGQILPVDDLDEIFDSTVRERYSHRMLNDLERFVGLVPTAENIARVLYEELAPAVARHAPARLAGVRIIETSHNYFEYGDYGDDSSRGEGA